MAKNRKIDRDINDLFNTTDAVMFEKKLNDIIRKYNKLLVQEKLREQYNNRALNNTLSISSTNDRILRTYLQQNNAVEVNNKNLDNTLSLVTSISNALASGFNWLDSIDGVIKTANLSLGLTKGIGIAVRDNLLEIGRYTASIGASMESVVESQVAYNNNLGRNVLLTKESMKALVEISKGLGLSNEFSGEIAANFERIGYNVENTNDFIEDAIISSGKMGVNVNKVLNNMNSIFNRANTFNFSRGITAFKEMMEYSEKFRINVDSAFNSMEMARTLEGGIEMAAKLMVMGGEFAKQNPFELSFLARNRPEEYIKKINQMTRGVYFFNQQTQQFQSSAFELDRLRASAEALGIPFNELNEQAMRLAQIDLAKSKLIGISEKDKEFISSIAEFNAKTGQFTVSINGNPVDIRKLNSKVIESYQKMTNSLEMRAKEAMTFNDSYNVFINEFKSLFLPLIQDMNELLVTSRKVLGDTGTLVVGGVAVLASLFGGLIKSIAGGIASIKTIIPSLKGIFGGGTIGQQGTQTTTPNPIGGKGFALNLTNAATILASGAAFMLYAKGIETISSAYKDLDLDKIKQLNITIGVGGAAMALGIMAIGKSALVGAPGLLTFGVTMGLVGVSALAFGKGIELASTGIGNMIEKISTVDTSSLMGIGTGIGAISLGIASFANPLTALGMAGFTTFIGLLTLAQKPLANLSNAFTSLSNMNNDFTGINKVLDKIQTFKTGDNDIINEIRGLIEDLKDFDKNLTFVKELKDLLSKPLKVEFDKAAFNEKIDLNVYLDSDVIYRKTLSRLPKDFDLISNNRMNNSGIKRYFDQ